MEPRMARSSRPLRLPWLARMRSLDSKLSRPPSPASQSWSRLHWRNEGWDTIFLQSWKVGDRINQGCLRTINIQHSYIELYIHDLKRKKIRKGIQSIPRRWSSKSRLNQSINSIQTLLSNCHDWTRKVFSSSFLTSPLLKSYFPTMSLTLLGEESPQFVCLEHPESCILSNI